MARRKRLPPRKANGQFRKRKGKKSRKKSCRRKSTRRRCRR